MLVLGRFDGTRLSFRHESLARTGFGAVDVAIAALQHLQKSQVMGLQSPVPGRLPPQHALLWPGPSEYMAGTTLPIPAISTAL